DRPLPWFFELGFPRPDRVQGAGLEVGDRRAIHFEDGQGNRGADGRGACDPGSLVVEIEHRTATTARVPVLADRSPIPRWLTWREGEVSWEPVDARHTRVELRLRYTRRLDPKLYFGPLERHGVGLAAEYFLECLDPSPERAPCRR